MVLKWLLPDGYMMISLGLMEGVEGAGGARARDGAQTEDANMSTGQSKASQTLHLCT